MSRDYGKPVTFRYARKSDLKKWDYTEHIDTTTAWPRKIPPYVVTVDGEIVLAFAKGQVVFQSGMDGIAHLIRAKNRVDDALLHGLIDHETRDRQRSQAVWDRFRDVSAWAEEETARRERGEAPRTYEESVRDAG